MTDKIYIDAREYLRDMWRLGRQILDSDWKPDVLLALWRGGAQVGVAVHEYLKVHGLSPRHMPVKCFSYTGIGTSNAEVRFEHAQPVFDAIPRGTKVLVLDDVFDTGRTAAAMLAELVERRGCEMKIGCVYWKPAQNVTSHRPDFHVRTVDSWIVFPHEIEGLTREEIAVKDPVLAELF